MKVKEMIEHLKKMPQDAELVIEYGGYYEDNVNQVLKPYSKKSDDINRWKAGKLDVVIGEVIAEP